MRIVGVLSWYDEPANWLATAVTGFGKFCDTIVAVDGAYALFPSAAPRSHPRQVEAITLAAEAQGVGCLIYQPQTVWRENEVGKRNAALQLALGVSEPGDWLCIFDADYHVQRANTEVLRWELENTECDVATYTLLESLSEPKSEWTVKTRDLYRWNRDLTVGPTHDSYSLYGTFDVTAIGAYRRWLRGQHEDLADALDLNDSLVCYHRSQERSEARRKQAERYYALRASTNIEALV